MRKRRCDGAMKRARDPSVSPPRRYRWTFLVGILLWLGFISGGVTFAYSTQGTGTFVKRISCTQGELCYYDTGQCDSQYVALANSCTSSSGGGGTTTSPQPSGGTFCWAQPSGGDNATINGNPGYLASCAGSSAAPACTPTGTGPSKFQSCDGTCHSGYYEPTNNCGSRNGSNYEGYAAGCTAGCSVAPTTTACTGTYHWAQTGCTSTPGQAIWTDYGPCGQVLSSNTGNATSGTCLGSGSGSGSGSTSTTTTPTSTAPAPSCTPSSSTSTGGTSWTGCASQGVESGTQSYTVYHSCPSYTSSGSRTLTQSTSTTCQSVVEHQCAYAQPGYAQSETCLTSPLGGTTNCSGWSTPYYDPHDCPIPTPVN